MVSLYREKCNDDNESLTAMVSTSSNNHEMDDGKVATTTTTSGRFCDVLNAPAAMV